LAKSYQENLPKIGVYLDALGGKIRLLETKNPASHLNPFMNLGSLLGGGSTSNSSYVLPNDFEKAKVEIEAAFTDVKAALQQQVGGGSAPAGLTAKVDKALKQLGEIQGRVTSKSFSMSN
jgi:hypothetical protein